MKKIKINKLTITILGVLVALNSIAQESENYPDTIVMNADNGVELTFAFDRVGEKANYFSNELWSATIGVMEAAIENSAITGGKNVIYKKVMQQEKERAQVEVEALPENEVYQIEEDGTQEFRKDRVRFEIRQKHILVSFVLNDLRDLQSIKELKIESLWNQIEQKFNDEGKRNLYFGNGKFNYGNAQIDRLEAKESGNDNIEITFIGIGMGYYRDRFVPDLGSKISFKLQNRLGNEWMEFGALYTQQYFFSRDESSNYQADLNGWVTGFWKMSTKRGEELGIGIGGLVHRDGGYFEGSTWKLSLYNKGSNSRFTFSPELIFTDDFKEVFPALRFGLSF